MFQSRDDEEGTFGVSDVTKVIFLRHKWAETAHDEISVPSQVLSVKSYDFVIKISSFGGKMRCRA